MKPTTAVFFLTGPAEKDIITPFALAAHSEGLSFRGGKLDDTTVVVGLVSWRGRERGRGEGGMTKLLCFPWPPEPKTACPDSFT